MKTIYHKSDTRGSADHGWLQARHSFSFAGYRDPNRVHFGVLRVLNDDRIAPGMGFGMHPHDNMEIITIPLEGDLRHKDNMGNTAVIHSGDIQVMSAGTGILHSEFNPNRDQEVKLLQIWLFPNRKDVVPRYDQRSLVEFARENEYYQILSPDPADQGVWIYQDAWFHLGEFEPGINARYSIKKPGNGVYAFMIEGKANIAGHDLGPRDALGISDTESFETEAFSESKILLMDIPMLP